MRSAARLNKPTIKNERADFCLQQRLGGIARASTNYDKTKAPGMR